MKIKTRLFTVFSFLLISMLLLSYHSIHTIRQMNKAMDQLVTEQYKMFDLANNVRNEINNLTIAVRNYILSDSDTYRKQQMDLMDKAKNNTSKALASLQKLTEDEQGKLIVYHIQKNGIQYIQIQANAVSQAQTGNREAASRLVTDDGQKLQEELSSQIDDLVQLDKHYMQVSAAEAYHSIGRSLIVLLTLALLFVLLGLYLTLRVTRHITKELQGVTTIMDGFSKGAYDLGTRLEIASGDEIGKLASAFNRMAETLELKSSREKELATEHEEQAWLHSALSKLSSGLQNYNDLQGASAYLLNEVVPMLGASYAVIYINQEDEEHAPLLQRAAAYAAPGEMIPSDKHAIKAGEGLIGQCAWEKKPIALADIPPDYMKIGTGLGNTPPKYVRLFPLLFGTILKGVWELAGLHPLTDIQEQLLQQASELFAARVSKIKSRLRIEQLLHETQAAAEELRMQQEELSHMNAELEEQTATLEESEQQLQSQQAGLEQMNDELQDKTRTLEEQNKLYQIQNQALERAKKELEKKTHELSEAISYKSTFLANMSHELRTPLNSMLILAKHLADNKENNLTSRQVEYASIVHTSGKDLLGLINEILDLAKVEARKAEIHHDSIELDELLDFAKRNFQPIAQQKNIDLQLKRGEGVPERFYSDRQKLLQILQNLLSNAFKFTDRGTVSFTISCPAADELANSAEANRRLLAFAIEDTGIGIVEEKREVIFEAFVQADGTTSRKYGGTGLGLSISREFARLLGGEIQLQSTAGEGSIFTLFIPVEVDSLLDTKAPEALFKTIVRTYDSPNPVPEREPASAPEPASVDSETGGLLKGKTVMLVDDDFRNVFALSGVLESYGLNILFAENGKEALELLDKHPETNGILMDIMMPEMDGYEAMKRIRQKPVFRQIPILAVTAKAMMDDRDKCIQAGASDYITKPVDVDKLLSLLKIWLYP